ncbi:MAG: hypothetical protein ACOYMA_03775 [Bacteroidia bacterium]
MRYIIQSFICFFIVVFQTKAENTVNKKDSIKTEYKNFAVSLGIGTTGYSGAFHYQLNNKIGFRLGYSRGYYDPNYFTTFSGNSINVTTEFNIETLNLLVDYFPFKNKIFRITGGIARNNNSFIVNVTPLSSATFGYIVYPPEMIGDMKLIASIEQYNPYLGIGFGKTNPKTKLGLGVDFGLYYHGSPKFKLIANGSFEPSNNPKNIQIFENAFKDWMFFPLVNLHIKYRILPNDK